MRRISIALLGGLLAAYASNATAVEFPNGLYAGGNAGIAEEEDTCSKIPTPAGFDEVAGCDDTDFGWQLFLGYQFMKWISVEGGYAYLGGSEYQVVMNSYTTKTEGWTLNGVITLPGLQKIGLYGIAGAFFWDRDVQRGSSAQGDSESKSDTGTDFYWGLGLRYPFTEHIGINLEVKNFMDVGSDSLNIEGYPAGESNYGLYTAGLIYRF